MVKLKISKPKEIKLSNVEVEATRLSQMFGKT